MGSAEQALLGKYLSYEEDGDLSDRGMETGQG
jgi:hypothetical protein